MPGDTGGTHAGQLSLCQNVTHLPRNPEFANLKPLKFFIVRGDETLYG